MSRFRTLLSVLDAIRREAKPTSKYSKIYAEDDTDPNAIWQARTRAYVHLYLKVMFGIRSFLEREHLITDGSNDGGIDGYYIDYQAKTIYIIQSKFRHNQVNFENKPITLEELLKMELKRVLRGEERGANGEKYNGKIKGFQRALSEIPNIPLYNKKVILLANVSKDHSISDLQKICDGYEVEIFDFNRSYVELLYPVLTGSLFKAKDISIALDLSNKSAGAKIKYNLSVDGFDCAITLVFVPIIEIARFMSEYQNSILAYNPRSYLEFSGAPVNIAIRDTAISPERNDFALLNNGITIICSRSSVTEDSGVKNQPILLLMNPQIINGGQTAYTLSRIYDDTPAADRDARLGGKEVLVKAMALYALEEMPEEASARRKLIERISLATNYQTAVTLADRSSTDDQRIIIQQKLYERHGILVENKRGEFAEGLRAKYISQDDILDRTLFQRLYFVANKNLNKSTRRRVWKERFSDDAADDDTSLDRLVIALEAWSYFRDAQSGKNPYLQVMPRVYACMVVAGEVKVADKQKIHAAARIVMDEWDSFAGGNRLRGKNLSALVASPEDLEDVGKHRGAKKAAGLASKIIEYFTPLKLH